MVEEYERYSQENLGDQWAGYENYRPVYTFELARLIIGAKKSETVQIINIFGKDCLFLAGSMAELDSTEIMLTIMKLLPDGTIQQLLGGVGIYQDGYMLPYSLFIPQFAFKNIWDPFSQNFLTSANSWRIKAEQQSSDGGRLWQIADWLLGGIIMKKIEEGGSKKIVFVKPEFWVVEHDGVDINNEVYWKRKALRAAMNFFNGFASIHKGAKLEKKGGLKDRLNEFFEYFVSRENKNIDAETKEALRAIFFYEDADGTERNHFSDYFIFLTDPQYNLLTRIRNDQSNIGLTLRETISKAGIWLYERMQRDDGTFYGSTFDLVARLLEKFGVIMEEDEDGNSIPVLDSDGNIQFTPEKDLVFKMIENPFGINRIFKSVKQLMNHDNQRNRKEIFRAYLSQIDDLTEYCRQEFMHFYNLENAAQLKNLQDYQDFMAQLNAFINQMREYVGIS